MDYLTSQATVKNCIGWMFSPLSTVGSPVGYLKTTYAGQDTAARHGSKHQSYTTWDCLSRQYLCGCVVIDEEGRGKREVTARMMTKHVDTPTEEDMKTWTPMQHGLYERGLRVFVRNKGLLTRKQLEKYLQSRLHQSTKPPKIANPPPADTASGFSGLENPPGRTRREDDHIPPCFYSDTLPVRCMAVSSMQAPRETEPMPWSPTFQLMASRLNDPAATGVLSAVVKGPNVRDATTWTSLVKSIMLRQSTRYEIAAMVRVLCMNLSLASEAYELDPTPTRFIRKERTVQYMGQVIYEKPNFNPGEYKIIAMPVDTFVAIANNSFFENAPTGFEYRSLDVDWVAVPVSSDMLGQQSLIPYVAAFLSSDLWSGTVNQHVEVEYEFGNVKRRMDESWMPCVNSVNIPGVKRVALILIDETSQTNQNNVRLATGQQYVEVPIWKGTAAVVPVSWGNLWRVYWNSLNIDRIRHTTILAHEKICTRMGVGDACGTAVSLVAELYGIWYQGFAPQYANNSLALDFSKIPHGAWTMDGGYLDHRKMFQSHEFTIDKDDNYEARRRTVAYNFSGISPMHLCPTGLTKIKYINDTERLRVTWANQSPEISVPGYNIQTMSSVYRVAAACGLILTHTDSYAFGEVPGTLHWIHMLSCAISFTTSSFLSINDMSPRDWMGIDNRYDVDFRLSNISSLKSALYGGLVIHRNMEELYAAIPEWDLDILSEYWGVAAYDDINWMTFSPVPFHATWQWMCKLQLESGQKMPSGVTNFRYNNNTYECLKLQRDSNEHKMNMACSIDVYRRCPAIIAREPDSTYVPVLQWVDNVHRYSSVMLPQMSVLLSNDMYESMTFCAPVENIGIPYSDNTTWYVYGSNYIYNDPILSGTKTSPIQWPDPPTIESMWNTAKNFILKPAASALVGFLTGGPAGAAVAGGTTLGKEIVEKMLTPKSRIADQEAQKVTVVENLGEKVQHEKKPSVYKNNLEPLKVVELEKTVKSTPTPAAETMVYKEPIKTLSILDESPVNE